MTVSALLRNPVLVGWMPHKGQVFTGPDGAPVRCVEGPTIMSEGERGTISAMVAGRSRLAASGRRQGRGASSTEALLSNGLLRCGRCGATMNPRGPQYTCYDATLRGTCEGLTVQRHVIEPEVLLRVTSHLAALDPSDADDLERLDAVARLWMVTADPEAVTTTTEAAGKLAGARERLARLEEAHYVTSAVTGNVRGFASTTGGSGSVFLGGWLNVSS